MKYLMLFLLLALTSCMFHPGVIVHTREHNGVVYTHCSILVSSQRPQVAEDALKTCRDAIEQQGVQPVRK